ncbi:hypothetical protein HGM15179_003219 [Zosterops borbonicus]|uniref:Uncharacterized protein n=1 Tax=Zosterops borbonicus TaxID=364589 RepID=A0A8K1GTR0_9PASS|nr:hypothetical protein HGM15179_003219 [Zosterops borbonicus]
MTLLFTAALIFLPDIGLWALYKEKQLLKPAEGAEAQVEMFNMGMLNMVKCHEEHLQSEILVLFSMSEAAWKGCTF